MDVLMQVLLVPFYLGWVVANAAMVVLPIVSIFSSGALLGSQKAKGKLYNYPIPKTRAVRKILDNRSRHKAA